MSTCQSFSLSEVDGLRITANRFICQVPTICSYMERYFASMREVVGRRYRRLRQENKPMPDLILVDGGVGQLHAAAQVGGAALRLCFSRWAASLHVQQG